MKLSTYEKWTLSSATSALVSFLYVQKDPAVRQIALGSAGIVGGFYSLCKTGVVNSLWQRFTRNEKSERPPLPTKMQLLTTAVGLGTMALGALGVAFGILGLKPARDASEEVKGNEDSDGWGTNEVAFIDHLNSCPAVDHVRKFLLRKGGYDYIVHISERDDIILNGVDYIYQLCSTQVGIMYPKLLSNQTLLQWRARVCQHDVAKSCIESIGINKLIDNFADRFPGWYTLEKYLEDPISKL